MTTLSERGGAAALVLGLGFTAALMIPVAYGSGDLTPSRLGAVLVVSLLSVFLGRALHRGLNLREEAGFSAAFDIVIGFSALSLLHLAFTALLNLSAAGALIADALATALAFAAAARWRRAPLSDDLQAQDSRACALKSLGIDILVLLLISLLVTFWTREALVAVNEAKATGILRVWNDFLLQAVEIDYLKDYPSFGGQSLYLADTAQPLYHRASYALPAAYAWMSNDPALETSLYFWMPAGIILLGTGAYGLGTVLAGRIAGILSVVGLFLLPDASMYWLKNGYFAFHWLIQVTPGAGYALAISLMALALYLVGVRQQRYALVLAALGLAVISGAFRMHIAIPAIMLLGILAFNAWTPSRPQYRLRFLGGFLAFAVVVMFAMERITLAPHFLSGSRDGMRYVWAVHAAIPIPYEGLYDRWTASGGRYWRFTVGYGLLLLAELGALLPAAAALTFMRIRKHAGLRHEAVIPFALLVIHTGITFLMPTAKHGDITEWSHRSFVLVYAVFLVFAVAWLADLCRQPRLHFFRQGKSRWILAALAILAGLTVPWRHGVNAQYGTLIDGPSACATPISQDMFKATAYIHDHASPHERLLASDADPIALAVSLTGLQAYVSRVGIYQSLGGASSLLANSRKEANAKLNDVTRFEDLQDFGKRTGIRWYLWRQQDMPEWPPGLLDRAVFVSGDIRVFDLQPR